MDKNEIKLMDEFFQSAQGKEYVCNLLQFPEFRKSIAEQLLVQNRNAIVDSVILLEFIISWATGEQKISPKIIEEKCGRMKKYSDGYLKNLRTPIFNMLILRQEDNENAKQVVSMLALINLPDLKDPSAVSEIVDSIADVAAIYGLLVDKHENSNGIESDATKADIMPDKEVSDEFLTNDF